jgi:hypothetical protein
MLDHTRQNRARYNSSEGVIGPSLRLLPATTHNNLNRQTFIPSAEFEPAISVSEWPQAYVLDRATTGLVERPFTMRPLCYPYTTLAISF